MLKLRRSQLRGRGFALSISIVTTIGLLVPACQRSADTLRSPASGASASETTVELSSSQLPAIKLQSVGSFVFYLEKKGVGNIDFDNKLYFDNTLAVQVFPPHQGTIIRTLAELGDEVQKGEPLYTIGSSRETEVEVRSPINGQVTAVNASPGLQVEPGKAPAPYAVADVSTKWMLGNVLESDSSFYRVGEAVEVRVMAYPGRVFEGRVIKVYPTVDGNTHRVMIRSEVGDPNNELRSGMLAEFVIRVQDGKQATAIPATGVVREPDGTMTAWVTKDRHHFSQRVIKTGLRTDNQVQIVEGLERGELVVTDGAVFLSNMLQAPTSD